MQFLLSKFKQISHSTKVTKTLILFLAIFLNSCATHHPQYGKKVKPPYDQEQTKVKTPISHRFFLIGDAGNADQPASKETLNLLKNQLTQADSASTLIFLGDNIYPLGMPATKNHPDRELAELKLNNQIEIAKSFHGNSFFIPGNHDWYSGLEGLKEQEKLVTKELGKKSFYPRKSCGIETVKVNDKIGMIVVDSQWYLENWDKHSQINSECSIKTREDFFEEFESLLNKNQNKTTLVVLHHPVISNGTHGGQFSLKKQLFPIGHSIPLPGLGSFINLLRKTSGVSPQDLQNPMYRSLSNRLTTLLEDRDNVIFISGHDHNLEYLELNNIKQIISGAGSKVEAARAIRKNDFSYGGMGYAVLDVLEDYSSVVRFYGIKNGKEEMLFQHQVTSKVIEPKDLDFPEDFPPTQVSQIYEDKLTKKGAIYSFLFGHHYRKYYNLPIEAPTLNLKDFDSSITPVRSGGGHQSKSLRLQTKDGKQFVMRALKKSATRFLQALVFKEDYMEKEFENTVIEDFILDFYTTTHPYYPFVINELAQPLGIYHTNPKLYYIPKQNILGKYNANFGDELYMVEERPMKKFSDADNFGRPNDIINTSDLLHNLQADEKYILDEKSYIKARLFDMLIGDWDRHQDQWRWAEFKEDGKVLYRPIPRDRDQVFPMYDGFLIKPIMRIPALRHMQNFGPDIRNVKWFNMEAYPLDLALIRQASLEDWLEQAQFIENTLTDELIDQSFRNLPKEVQDEEVVKVKDLLKIRKKKLTHYAEEYFRVLHKTVVLYATNKDDSIVINRLDKGNTQIQMYRKKKTGNELFFDKTYNKKWTKDIWIYGLNDQDDFVVKGKPQQPILIRLIGGNDKDTYRVERGRKVRIYDNNRPRNDIKEAKYTKVYLSNDYELNNYNYEKPAYNRLTGLPSGGYNPDDGLKLGLSYTFTENSFDRDPYTRKHNLTANYYFATTGTELTYTGTFVKFINKWNLELEARFTTPTYTHNFFGFGNLSENNQKSLGMDYNRVKIQSLSVQPSLYRMGRNHGRLEFNAKLEDIQVMRTGGRITETTNEIPDGTFNHQQFGEIGFKYSYNNYDNPSVPTLGIIFEAEAHWITNLGDTKKSFPYVVGALGFTHRITHNEILTFASFIKGKYIWNGNFEFFQAASIGGDNNVRAYRFDRFLGRQSLYHSADLRLRIGKTKNFSLPLKFGILIGYDQGRVWMDDEKSDKWHQSIGGGIWINGANTLTGTVNYFHGSDGGRVSFGVNFGF